MTSKFDKIMDLALRRGFFFPAAGIYSDSPAGFWDYGPYGAALKRKIIELWRREVVKRDEMWEIDGSEVLPESVFKASGHLKSFSDPIVECLKCHSIHRADRIIQDKTGKIIPESLPDNELGDMIRMNKIICPKCKGELGGVSRFNMMFSFGIGPKAIEKVYLRPETCQNIFCDFPRLFRVMRGRLPIGIAQTGKSFRNEISPRQALLRERELCQAEAEIFFNPKNAEHPNFDEVKDYELNFWEEEKILKVKCGEAVGKFVSSQIIAFYLAIIQQFFDRLGISSESIRLRKLEANERAFYARESWDLEVNTSFGWVECVACNNRGDYDLKGHGSVSNTDLSVMDNNEKVLPHVFELSMGIDRDVLAVIDAAYSEENERTFLKLPGYIAPIQAAIFPLVDKDEMDVRAIQIYEMLKYDFDCEYDDKDSIGRRYRRMDEIGTPIAITVDGQTMKDDTVTVRERDSMKQMRVKISELSHGLKIFLSSGDFESL